MRGYKGMRYDMTCLGMKYEIGKTYHVDGDINICSNGFHFCENLIDVLNFYMIDNDNRYFEVEADGEIKTDGTKSVASSLTIIREITNIELNRTIHDPGYCDIYNYGDGTDYGYGTGDLHGYGFGDGYGDGYGDGNDNGYGNGDGYGYGSSDGSGDGYGDGYGYSYGHGDGYGDGYGDGTDNNYYQNIIKYV